MQVIQTLKSENLKSMLTLFYENYGMKTAQNIIYC